MTGEGQAAREIVLINVSGPDRPGITAALSGVLARHGVEVLDIGQSVIHDHLAWGMLIEVPPGACASPLFRDLLFTAHEMHLDVRLTPVDEREYERWVAGGGEARHTVTLLGHRLHAGHIARVAEIMSSNGLNIDMIVRISGRASLETPLGDRRAAVEFSARGAVADMSSLHAAFLGVAREMELDVAIQADDVFRRYRRLICFDMDSTLIEVEVIDELARAAGVGGEVTRLTECAMRGEIDFRESFTRRVAALCGLDADVLPRIAEQLPLTEGAERLISTLKQLGYRIAIVSGGFRYFAEHLQRRLGIDYVYAHELDVADGKLTGRVVGDVIDGERKAEILREIAAREGIRLEQVIAVGDGANDLPMLSIAGLGIAFHARPVVNERARHAIATLGLDGILYLLGMRDRELAAGLDRA